MNDPNNNNNIAKPQQQQQDACNQIRGDQRQQANCARTPADQSASQIRNHRAFTLIKMIERRICTHSMYTSSSLYSILPLFVWTLNTINLSPFHSSVTLIPIAFHPKTKIASAVFPCVLLASWWPTKRGSQPANQPTKLFVRFFSLPRNQPINYVLVMGLLHTMCSRRICYTR